MAITESDPVEEVFLVVLYPGDNHRAIRVDAEGRLDCSHPMTGSTERLMKPTDVQRVQLQMFTDVREEMILDIRCADVQAHTQMGSWSEEVR